MRVLLVAANREKLPDPIFPLGLAYIASATREAGHDVHVVDLCFGRNPLKQVKNKIRSIKPDVVALSIRNVDNAAYPLTISYLDLHKEVVDTIRANSNAPVIIGGSGFSILPDEFMKVLNADIGITGEGEHSFVKVLAHLDRGSNPSRIPGVVMPYNNKLVTAIPEIDLPEPKDSWQRYQPARDLFDYPRYIRRGGTGNIQTKRGCVFKCNYCTYPLLEGNRFRAREAVDVVDEIESIQQQYGPHPVFFVDSIFNFPVGHIESICEEIIRRKLNIRWSCYATPIKLNEKQANLMARAGCEGVELGTDAVDNFQLKNLSKSFDAETVFKANQACIQAGLRVCHTVIFGAPGETTDSVRNTCNALIKMKPTAVVAMTGVRVYPNTPLANQLINDSELQASDIGLMPLFYIASEVRKFLPNYLLSVAKKSGNWILPGLVTPILPMNQRLLRAIGVSGPLWKLLEHPVIRKFSKGKFGLTSTSWGSPQTKGRVKIM